MILALITIVIMTLLGLALMYITSTEGRMAASTSTVSKSLYSADSGVQWTATQMIGVGSFFTKTDFTAQGFTEFRLPDHLASENAACAEHHRAGPGPDAAGAPRSHRRLLERRAQPVHLRLSGRQPVAR